eukprot:4106429-Alexandrium_andersonii.AAC.1
MGPHMWALQTSADNSQGLAERRRRLPCAAGRCLALGLGALPPAPGQPPSRRRGRARGACSRAALRPTLAAEALAGACACLSALGGPSWSAARASQGCRLVALQAQEAAAFGQAGGRDAAGR